jgi:hypothetical protein
MIFVIFFVMFALGGYGILLVIKHVTPGAISLYGAIWLPFAIILRPTIETEPRSQLMLGLLQFYLYIWLFMARRDVDMVKISGETKDR